MSFPKELILFSVEEFKDHSLFILCAVYDGWIKCLLFDILHIMEKEKRRILLIGDSLFTDSLVQLLADVENIELIGTAVSPTFAITAVAKAVPHIIIIANASENTETNLQPLLAMFPAILIIHADLNQDYVQIITSRRVSARRTDLLAAIQELSIRD